MQLVADLPAYQIIKILASGEHSTTLLARSSLDGLDCVIKCYPRNPRPEYAIASHRPIDPEISALASSEHPGLPRVRTYGVTDTYRYIIVDHAEGIPITAAARILSREHFLYSLIQLASTLEYLHRRGFAHADIKPEHILVSVPTSHDRLPSVQLVDFDSVTPLGHQRKTGLKTTPRYASTELLASRCPTIATDLYALGVVLMECIYPGASEHTTQLSTLDLSHFSALPTRLSQFEQDLAKVARTLVDTTPFAHHRSEASLGSKLEDLAREHGMALSARITPSAHASGPPVFEDSHARDCLSEATDILQHTRRPVLVEIRGAHGSGRSRLASYLSQVVYSLHRPLAVVTSRSACESFIALSCRTIRNAHIVVVDAPADHELAILTALQQRMTREQDPFLLILTTLPSYGAPDNVELTRQRIRLLSKSYLLTPTPLTRTSLVRSLKSGLGVTEIAESLPSVILDAAGGNPGRCWQFLRLALQEGRIVLDGNSLVLDPTKTSGAVTADNDPSVTNTLLSLPNDAQRVLQLLSVSYAPLTVSMVCSVLPLTTEHVSHAIILLELHGLVQMSSTEVPVHYTAAGDIVRSAALAMVPTADRTSLHSTLARTISTLDSSPAGFRAAGAHLVTAGEPRAAAVMFMKAGKAADSVDAHADAVLAYRSALEHAHHLQGHAPSVALRLSLALSRSGRHEEALTAITGVDRLSCRSSSALAKVLLRESACYYTLGNHDNAARTAREALALSPWRRSRSLHVEALRRLGAALCWQDDRLPGVRLLFRSLVYSRKHHNRTLAIDALRDVASSHWRGGQYAMALRYERRRLRLLKNTADPQVLTYVHQNLGILLSDLGRYREARAHYRTAYQKAVHAGNLAARGSCLINVGETFRVQGHYRVAFVANRRALRLYHELQEGQKCAIAKSNLAGILAFTGSSCEANDLLRNMLALPEIRRSTLSQVMVLLNYSRSLLSLGRSTLAQRVSLRAIRLVSQASLTHVSLEAHSLLAESYLALFRPDAAFTTLCSAIRASGTRTPLDVRLWASYLRLYAETELQGGTRGVRTRIDRLLRRATRRGMLSVRGYLLLLKARVCMNAAEWEEAEQFLLTSCDMARSTCDRNLLWHSWKLLGLVNEGRLRYRRALYYYRKAVNTINEMSSEIRNSRFRTSFMSSFAVRETVARCHDLRVRAGDASRNQFAALTRSESVSRKMLASLSAIGQKLSSILDLSQLLDSILDLAIENVHAERGAVFLRDSGSSELRVASARGVGQTDLEDLSSLSRSVVARAGEGQGILTVDVGQDPTLANVRSLIVHEVKSILCVPMRSRGEVVGVIYLDTRKTTRLFTEKERAFVESFSSQAAIAIENARMFGQMKAENDRLRREARGKFPGLDGNSVAMRRLGDSISGIVGSDCTVLVTGESGTGKGVVARTIHEHSTRRDGPFMVVDCGALPENLLEGELFGYRRGAFTGAERDRVGLLEEATGGTLFLDEITNTSLAFQARLLRVLQEREVRRLGENHARRVDVRVIAATNADLAALMAEGRFRRDLFYRLNVVSLLVPPLRERPEDIPILAGRMLERRAREGEKPRLFGPGVVESLMAHSWPGNVRELENLIERLVVLCPREIITVEDLPEELRRPPEAAATRAAGESNPRGARQGEPERRAPDSRGAILRAAAPSPKTGEQLMIEDALARFQGDKVKAARFIGWNRQKLYRRMKTYGIPRRYGKAA